MEAFRSERRKILIGGIIGNLTLLGIFKYANFFTATFVVLLQQIGFPVESSKFTVQIILPLGISFFVFQKIAYLIDIYRGEVLAERSFLVFLCFVLFFPQLVAGPIERANHLIPQFKAPRFITSKRASNAVWLICWGLFLKIAVADSLGHVVDNAFRADQQFGWSVVLGSIAFGLQIYGDFCGYSFMAKGLAALLGFDLMWNFRRPYASKSIQEFWQRWHVTLGRWLRDYLYIPLGGNRCGPLRTEINLLTTMALGGLWHGASWSFVAWGLFHGLALSIHRRWKATGIIVPATVAWSITMVTVMVGWFLFRAQTGTMVMALLKSFSDFGWRPGHSAVLLMIIILSIPIVVVEAIQERANDPYIFIKGNPFRAAVINATAVLCTLALIGNVQSKFIYFQF
jgi:alginate O-acetyltransferase complex protein AlgI